MEYVVALLPVMLAFIMHIIYSRHWWERNSAVALVWQRSHDAVDVPKAGGPLIDTGLNTPIHLPALLYAASIHPRAISGHPAEQYDFRQLAASWHPSLEQPAQQCCYCPLLATNRERTYKVHTVLLRSSSMLMAVAYYSAW